MRVLYLITRSEPGGAQVHLLELLRGFRDRAELHVAVGKDEDSFLVEAAEALGVRVHILEHLVWPLHPVKDLAALVEILRLIRKLQPHLLHAHSSKAGILGRVAARITGVKSLFTAHGWAFTEGVHASRRALALSLEWIAGRLGNGVICVSQKDLELARDYRIASPSKRWVVWNGIPDTPYRAEPLRNPPKLVMVARFSPQKDHSVLLKALAEVKERPWTMELIGDGPLLPQVQALAAELGLGERVRFLGRRLDVDVLLAQAQIFVLTSNWEGLPLSILEAMRAGLPVIASNVGGVPEAVEEGVNGFLVPRGDVLTLSERLAGLMENPDLRGAMGQASRLRYEQYFSVEGMLEKAWSIYAGLVKI